jgi:DNA mismatch repair ATPase MutS
LVLQHSCEELSAAAAGLQELRVTVEQLEQDASEVVRLQQRKEALAGVPQQLLQLRQEVGELQQMADDQQAMQVRLLLGLVEQHVPRFEKLQAELTPVICVGTRAMY